MCCIDESNNTSTLLIDELQITLLMHEQRMSYNIHEELILKVTLGDHSIG